MSKKRVKKYVFLFAFLSTSLFFLLFSLPAFRPLENVTYDWRMRMMQGSNNPSGEIVLVFVCDETLDMLGEWPLNRLWYSELTSILAEMGARGIVFDILFIDKKKEDGEFAGSIMRSGSVILPFFLDSLNFSGGAVNAGRVVYPVKELKDSALGTGFINSFPDADGIIRKYPLEIESEGTFYEPLAICAIKKIFGGEEVLRQEGCIGFNFGGKTNTIPVDRNSNAYVNFYHDLKKFPNYSFVQVFQSYLQARRGEVSLVPEDAFKDKVVIIGSVATGASDTGPVAGLYNYPLMGMHARFLENFFQGTFINKAGPLRNFLFPLLFSTAAGFVASFSFVAGIIAFMGISALFIVLAVYLFVLKFTCVDILPALGAIIAVYITVIAAEFLSERREKQKVKKLFGRYIAPSLMEKLLGQRGEISLVGEKKLLTVLFADIRGFTSFAERNTPEDTFSFLNKVLSVMSEAVFKYNGTLDKFIGDEVMAIYGAPLDDPGHCLKAVMSAAEMMKNLKILTPDVKIGIGINTGEVIIGNIGTEKRMEYTAIGDTVNTAARIEAETSGGDIFIGEETYNSVKDDIPCEPLGSFRIRGKKGTINLYRVKV